MASDLFLSTYPLTGTNPLECTHWLLPAIRIHDAPGSPALSFFGFSWGILTPL